MLVLPSQKSPVIGNVGSQAVYLNRESSLSQGLLTATFFDRGDASIDLVSGKQLWSFVNTISAGAGVEGKEVANPTADGQMRIADHGVSTALGTYVLRFVKTAAGDRGRLITNTGGENDLVLAFANISDTTYNYGLGGSGGGLFSGPTTAFPDAADGAIHTAIWDWDDAANQTTLTWDGNVKNTDVDSFSYTAADLSGASLVIGDRPASARHLPGEYYFAAFYNRLLNDAEKIEISFNPYQLISVPALILFPVGVAPTGRIMSSLAGSGGLAGRGGIAGAGGGLAG